MVRPPFVLERRVTWSDVDTARIVYTGRFPDYVLEAIEAFFLDRFGVDWYRLNLDEGLGTPFVNLSLDFVHPVTPRDALAIEVGVSRVGRSSVTYAVTGRLAARGVDCFRASATCVFVVAGRLASIAIPARFRKVFEAELDRGKSNGEDGAVTGPLADRDVTT